MDLPCLSITHCDCFHGPVPVTRTMTPVGVGGEYEWETGKVIVERVAGLDSRYVSAVLGGCSQAGGASTYDAE